MTNQNARSQVPIKTFNLADCVCFHAFGLILLNGYKDDVRNLSKEMMFVKSSFSKSHVFLVVTKT